MTFPKTLLLFLFICFLAVPVRAQANHTLEGTWELVSQKVDGKDHAILGRQIKLLTKGHYMWVRQDKQALLARLEKKTTRDSMEAYQDTYGAGTYAVSGNMYTETTEFFYAPAYIGNAVHFTFRFDGPRWVIDGAIPLMKGNEKVGEEKLEEVWKRID